MMRNTNKGVTTGHASMWPREIFDVKTNGQLIAQGLDFLKQPGVYILYRDEVPYYIGQTIKSTLYWRIWNHATNPARKRYKFWNFFSAFAVPDPSVRAEIEAVLIAAMPTANSSKPKVNKIRLPRQVRNLMNAIRQQKVKGLME